MLAGLAVMVPVPPVNVPCAYAPLWLRVSVSQSRHRVRRGNLPVLVVFPAAVVCSSSNPMVCWRW